MKMYNFKYKDEILMTVSFYDDDFISIEPYPDKTLEEIAEKVNLKPSTINKWTQEIIDELQGHDWNYIKANIIEYKYCKPNMIWEEVTKYRTISVEVDYGWPGGTRSGVIQVPDADVNYIDEYIVDWVMKTVTWTWEDITGDRDEN